MKYLHLWLDLYTISLLQHSQTLTTGTNGFSSTRRGVGQDDSVIYYNGLNYTNVVQITFEVTRTHIPNKVCNSCCENQPAD